MKTNELLLIVAFVGGFSIRQIALFSEYKQCFRKYRGKDSLSSLSVKTPPPLKAQLIFVGSKTVKFVSSLEVIMRKNFKSVLSAF